MAEDTLTELGLTTPPESPEPRKLPDGIVLTFSVEPNTGIRVVSSYVEKVQIVDPLHDPS